MPRKTSSQARRSAKGKLPAASPRQGKPGGFSKLLGPKKLKQLYSTMLRCRMVQEKLQQLSSQGRLSRNHLGGCGLEAVEVGSLIDLLPKDCISCGRRDVIAGYIRGAPLEELFGPLLAEGTASGRCESVATKTGQGAADVCILAGASTLAVRTNISAGVALAFKMQKKPQVVVAFSSDDAIVLNSWRESVQFAVVHKLPIVHVVQNDLGTEPSGPKPQTSGRGFETSSPAPGIPTLVVDGTDVVAVYRVAQEAIRRAREGHGPALIECKSHRWGASSEVDPARPSSPSQNQKPKSPDPLVFMENYLRERGVWSETWKDKLVKTFNRQMTAAVKSVSASRIKAAG